MFIPNTNLIDSEIPTDHNYFYGLQSWTLTVDNIKVNYLHGLQGQLTLIFNQFNLVVTMFASDLKSGGRPYNEPMQINIIREIIKMLNLK